MGSDFLVLEGLYQLIGVPGINRGRDEPVRNLILEDQVAAIGRFLEKM